MQNGKKSDYLKFHKIIIHFFKLKHKIGEAQMDLMLFLYSERYFDNEKVAEYGKVLGFKIEDRLGELIRDGWVVVWREGKVGHKKNIYRLSIKAINMVESIYRKLEGEEIPDSPYSSRLFYKNVRYTDRQYQKMIKSMNDAIRKHRNQEAIDLSLMYN